MSPENQADHEVVPAARFVGDEAVPVRLPTDGTGSSIMVAVLRRDLLPPQPATANCQRTRATIPRANPFASNVCRNHHSLTYAAKAACRAKANTVELAVTYCRGGDCEFVPPLAKGQYVGPSFAIASLSLQLLSTCAADMGSKWVRDWTANRVTPATSGPCPPCRSQELLWLRTARNTMTGSTANRSVSRRRWQSISSSSGGRRSPDF